MLSTANSRRVVGDAHVDQGAVAHHIVGAVGDGLALAQVREVMHLHRLGLPFGPPGASRVTKRPYQLLLLGVHRHHRITGLGKRPDLAIEIAKLRIAVRMLLLPSVVLRLACSE